jgi:hypothetical protein
MLRGQPSLFDQNLAMPWFKVSIRSTTFPIAIASIDFGATLFDEAQRCSHLSPSRAKPTMPPARLNGELLRPEAGDPRYPTDKIRSIVRHESARIRRTVVWCFVDLTQSLFES